MKRIIRSLSDLPNALGLTSEISNLPGDRPKTPGDRPTSYPGDFRKSKVVVGYTIENIRMDGLKFQTTDGNYETYRDGDYSYWRRTMTGEKNGASDINSTRGMDYVFVTPQGKEKALSVLLSLITK
jgi:hypothetical protein